MVIQKAFLQVATIHAGLASRLRNVWYRLIGVKISGYVWMRKIDIPQLPEYISLQPCSLDRGVTLLCGGGEQAQPKITIGNGSYLNRNTFVDATESIIIGRHVAIGPGCYITDHDHGTNADQPPLERPMVSSATQLEDHVWLGANVVVLKGVRIGARSIVGAGSVVTKSIPADCVAVGTPARVIRSRTQSEVPT